MYNPFPKSKKQIKRDIIEENRRKGRAAEEQVKMEYELRGYTVKKTHAGSDYVATRPNMWTGKTERKIIEVKSGNAKLSNLQQKTKKNKSNYTVERRDPFFW